MTDSTAPLPAARIMRACVVVLGEIDDAREVLLNEMAEAKRGRGWWLPRRSLERARCMLTESEMDVVAFHRAAEENRLRNLLFLARAAADVREDLSVTVSAGDFHFLRGAYDEAGSRQG